MGANFELTDNNQVKMETGMTREEILNQLVEKLL